MHTHVYTWYLVRILCPDFAGGSGELGSAYGELSLRTSDPDAFRSGQALVVKTESRNLPIDELSLYRRRCIS